MTKIVIFQNILAERQKQDAQWGGPEHDDKHDTYEFVTFIDDQISKLDDEIENAEMDDSIFRSRLVKMAAIAVAGIEVIDRHRLRNRPQKAETEQT